MVPGMDTKSRAYAHAMQVLNSAAGTSSSVAASIPHLPGEFCLRSYQATLSPSSFQAYLSFSFIDSLVSELHGLGLAAYSLHQQHTGACNSLVVQQQLLTVDSALIQVARDLESFARHYMFLASEQDRLLQLLSASSTQ